MTRGYIIIAQNTPDHDYLKMAYALALSIKATQRKVNQICICTDMDTIKASPNEYLDVFDHIEIIQEVDSDWKIENKWMYNELTPFDETMILDADMVFTESIDDWWDILSTKDFCACVNTKTFRNEPVSTKANRLKFVDKKLPNIYTNMTYFKKSELTDKIFGMVKSIFMNWDEYYLKYLLGPGQKHLSADVAFALAIRLTGTEEQACHYELSIPTFVHMKNNVQNVLGLDSNWENNLSCIVSNDLSISVGHFKQIYPFHYVTKYWLTDDRFKQYEDTY